jgi:RimJ/RimL family protein N-acetyltransferase
MSETLKRLTQDDREIIKIFYEWKAHEKHFEYYTCRPVKTLDSFEAYLKTMAGVIEKNITYYLQDDNNRILGKITLFDYNPRNQSAEFGYYLPMENRGKGYGKRMLSLFLEEVFTLKDLKMNKLYASTASCNGPSKHLLEYFSFKLDGVMREHYWIGEERLDQLYYSLLKREWQDKK